MEQEEHWWKGASVSQKRKNRKAEKLKSRKEEKQRNRKSRKAEQSSRNPQAKGQTKRKTKDKKKQKKKTVPQDGGWGDAPPLWWRDMPGKKCAFPTQCLSVFFTISNTQKHTNVITKGITRGQLRSRLHSQQWRKWNPICCVRTGRRRVKPGWLHKLGLHPFCFQPELGRAMECVLHRPTN